MLESKHHVCDLESTETVTCSTVENDFNQNISWYNGGTNDKIKTGGRIELNGLSLKINNVQLDDAGTYECRGASSTRFYSIYVNGEYSLFSFYWSLRHYFVTPHHEYNAMFIWYYIVLRLMLFSNKYYHIIVTQNLIIPISLTPILPKIVIMIIIIITRMIFIH